MEKTLGFRADATPAPKSQKEIDLMRRVEILDRKTKEEAETTERERIRRETPFELLTRPLAPGDFNFILNAWMKSYRDSKRLMRSEVFYAGQQNLIAEIAKRRTAVVGCDAAAPDWIAGFAVGQLLADGTLILDYVYVKSPYRERGIALQLVGSLGWCPGTPIIATHMTKQAEKLSRKYEVTYNEYFNAIGYSSV
jgi:hypothetical protein